jgi:hypothetical protein
MPNATVRASARSLPEETNRRAVLGAVLAAATAAAALPALAAASVARSHHPDADLFALIERARTADALADEASMAADDVLFKIAPSFPQALIWAETDDPFWYGVKSGERIPVRDIDFLRDWLKLPERPDRPWPQDICRFPLIPLRAFAERAREIVRAKDEFEASWQGRRGTSGRARGECETRSSLGAMERTGNARCDDSSENHGGPDRQVRLDRVRILRRRH